MSGNGKSYNTEFRADAIRLVEEGRSVNSVANDLGINEKTLRNWLNRKKKKEDPAKSKIDELKHKLREKQKKINELEESVDILKNLPPSLSRTTEGNL
jgi:transposase-like protein